MLELRKETCVKCEVRTRAALSQARVTLDDAMDFLLYRFNVVAANFLNVPILPIIVWTRQRSGCKRGCYRGRLRTVGVCWSGIALRRVAVLGISNASLPTKLLRHQGFKLVEMSLMILDRNLRGQADPLIRSNWRGRLHRCLVRKPVRPCVIRNNHCLIVDPTEFSVQRRQPLFGLRS